MGTEVVKAKRTRYEHRNVVCHHCKNEIVGPRYKCGNCNDYDLCEKCEAIEGLHPPSHVFVKMHLPAVLTGQPELLLVVNIYEGEKEREEERKKVDSDPEADQKLVQTFGRGWTMKKEVEQENETSGDT